MKYFVHSSGLCESDDIGEGTRVWAFAHVLQGAVIGRDCNVCDHVFVEGDVVVGDRVTIKSGVQLWDGTRIGDDVFIGPNATFTNDPFPRSKRPPASYVGVEIGEGASLGANCTLLPGVRVGRNAMVGAGSVVTRDVPANAIVVGNPARIIGYAGVPQSLASSMVERELPQIAVDGPTLRRVRQASDLRGSLIATEFVSDLPFKPQRMFAVFDVPSKDIRGAHAHRECEQFLICLRGQVSCVVDDGENRQELVLDRPDIGLHIPPMIWGTQYLYSSDAVLLVLASLPYDPDDYIREYDEFIVARQSPIVPPAVNSE